MQLSFPIFASFLCVVVVHVPLGKREEGKKNAIIILCAKKAATGPGPGAVSKVGWFFKTKAEKGEEKSTGQYDDLQRGLISTHCCFVCNKKNGSKHLLPSLSTVASSTSGVISMMEE